ncbi:uncharacterized protein DFL_008439 [Arthrobotrys flagrans]|uniref:UBC core domain-containing protein n=1 Tax=Arthrobotrys flagrans TaxID=97331 RepID=A0A436ZNS1_ARTFL|nr:hypothetical protein DFL_008439 [Arthrobotrys flagrans]
MAVPPGKPMDPCIESSRSPGVGLRRKASAVLSPDVPADFQKIQTFFAQFLGEERSVTLPCPHGPSALSSIFDVIKSVDRKKGANLPYNHHGKTCFFKCPECKMIVCAGCGSKVGKLRVPFSDISHRCIDAYLLSFVLVLAKIDARWQLREFSSRSLAPQKKVNASASAMASTSIQTKTLPPLQHVSLTPPSKSRAGTGYGTGQVGGRKSASRKIVKTAAKIKQESEDNNYLTGLLGRLVRLTADGAGELSMTTLLEERKDLLVSIIKVSYLPELIGSLVCNDSIMDIDIHNTWEMYSMCLNLLQFFSAYEPLLEFLVTGPQEKKSSPGIANLIKMPNLDQLKGFAPNKKRMGVLATLNPVEFVLAEGFDGIGQSIVHSLPRLAKQCQAFMNNASRLLYQDEETKRLLSLCDNVETTAIELDKRAQELREKKDKARPSPPYKNSHPASFSPDSLAHPIFSSSRGPFSSTSAQKSNPFGVSATVQQECRHALSGYLQFNYSYKVIDTHSSANPHTIFYGNNPGHSSATIGCMRRLAKELTVLATGLPPGIYIRVQEDRLDFFKAIIVGPESSPYHLGLYEFDFTIPPDYPNTPPLVTFKTTGGARVRFNPNLYETGKVCLSILGTWGGSASEQWQPKTSTLLQVLVSIQGMILCAEPYYNEPGYEQMFAPKASKSYNQNVQLNSMRLAMADWLAYSGLWDEVVQAHFLAYAEEILSTTRDFVNKTSNNDAPPHNTAGFAIPQPMPAFGNQLHPLMPTHDSMKTVMENMRQVLEDTMKFRLPKFLAAGLWKEPSDSINLTDSVDESSE